MTREELLNLWQKVRKENVEIDLGETEWMQVGRVMTSTLFKYFFQEMERRRERDEMGRKKKATFCSTDILSKMFGTSFQVNKKNKIYILSQLALHFLDYLKFAEYK